MDRRALAILGLLLSGGCIAATPSPTADVGEGAFLPAPPTGFAFECPRGPAITRSDGLCIGTYSSPSASFTEPYVRIHPQRPEAIVIGVNAIHNVDALQPSETGASAIRLDLLVSQDAGASWKRVAHPEIPAGDPFLRATNSGDPALAFDSRGTLHVTGIALLETAGGPLANEAIATSHVFYASTPDLGTTWTPPLFPIPELDSDRPWISVDDEDRIFISWQNSAAPFEVGAAWSLDAGQTWTSDRFPDCTTASRFDFVEDENRLACALVKENVVSGLVVLRVDLPTGKLVEVGRVERPGAVWPMLVASPDGALHLSAETDDRLHLWFSQSLDFGASWSEAVDLRDTFSIEDGWETANTYAFEADPWGSLHWIVASTSDTPVQAPLGPTARPVAHVALRGLDRAVLSERLLSPRDIREELRVPPAGPTGVAFDEYYGLDFTGKRGFAAWVRNSGIDYSLLVPE